MKKNILTILLSLCLISSVYGCIQKPQDTAKSSVAETRPPIKVSPQPTVTPQSMVLSPSNASQIVELKRFGKGIIKQLLLSPDGKTIAMATSIGIYFYDAVTLSEISYIDTQSQVTSIAFTPDSQSIAASGGYSVSTIRLWDIKSTNLIRSYTGFASPVNCISITPKNSILATGGDDGSIRLLNLLTGEIILEFKDIGSRVESVAFDSKGKLLATGTHNGIIQIWDPSTGSLLNTYNLPHGEYSVMVIALSPDSRYLASGGNDGQVNVWDLQKGKVVLTGDVSRTTGLEFDPTGSLLASASDNGIVSVWETKTWNLVLTIKGHTNSANAVAFSQNGKNLITGSIDGTIKIWNSETGAVIDVIEGFSNFILDIALSPDEKIILSAGWKGIDVWNVDTQQRIDHLEIGELWLTSVAFSPDGRLFASLACAEVDAGQYCQRSIATLWNARSRTVVKTIYINENAKDPVDIVFSSDSKLLITADGYEDNKNIKIWDVESGDLLHVLDGGFVNDMILYGNEIIAASWNEIQAFDIYTYERIFAHSYWSGTIVTISPDGKLLAGANDNLVSVWDLKAVHLIHEFTHLNVGNSLLQIDALAFNPTGSLLISGDTNGLIKFRDTSNWAKVGEVKHSDILSKLVFTRDGKNLISSSFDGTIRIWGVNP